ncbi:MAG TPA: U32 family peptidase [Kofleriaceae bacterium]|jgi:putative protease
MRRPEILAPAGDRDALAAALAAGADAVYLGLDDGFNARARAHNFPSDGLAAVAALVHRAGARMYVTLNTLVFEPELAVVEELIRRVAAAGVDAIIVQDPAVALLARAICPQLEAHGSTQMTASSPLAAELLKPLGLTRIVVPRELNVDEIRAYAAGTSLPLEVFVHGALCVAWSGQCLSSEAWGGRSANRGQCAQACRLPYKLVVDGTVKDLGEIEYLLSPKDLVGDAQVPALADIGVASLKIEGRLKPPHYVATTVAHYKAATAAAVGAPAPTFPTEIPHDDAAVNVAYSRGISAGFLGGADHQTLVEGRFPRHRGLPIGKVVKVERDAVFVVASPNQRPVTGGLAIDTEGSAKKAENREDAKTQNDHGAGGREVELIPRAGMGVVFDAGRPDENEQGGPIFSVDKVADGYRLRFGNPGPDLSRVRAGDFVWVSSDPKVTRAGEKAAEAAYLPLGRIGLTLQIAGTAGEPLHVTAYAKKPTRDRESNSTSATPTSSGGSSPPASSSTDPTLRVFASSRFSASAEAQTASPLAAAQRSGLSRETLVDKLGAFGGTIFHLAELKTDGLADGLHIPVSELKEVRRQLVASLEAQIVAIDRDVATESVLDRVKHETALLAHAADASQLGVAPTILATSVPETKPIVVPLCRTDEQLDAVIAAGAKEVELDWMELVGLAKAVARAKAAGVRVGIATVRVQKPGEEKIDAHIAKLEPDHVLVRSWGSLAAFTSIDTANRPALHGDFSLNVTNSITANWVLSHGVETVTAAHDLDRDQLLALLDAAPKGRVAVTVHHHIPTFHTEHCVYAHLLSTGRDYKTCGRPCEDHAVSLRDRVGLVHPVVVDVGCRNTVFNAQAQSAASLVPELLARGVLRMRVELVRETAAEATRLYLAYAALAAGELAPEEVVRRAEVHEQFGVTRGTMRTLTVLR